MNKLQGPFGKSVFLNHVVVNASKTKPRLRSKNKSYLFFSLSEKDAKRHILKFSKKFKQYSIIRSERIKLETTWGQLIVSDKILLSFFKKYYELIHPYVLSLVTDENIAFLDLCFIIKRQDAVVSTIKTLDFKENKLEKDIGNEYIIGATGPVLSKYLKKQYPENEKGESKYLSKYTAIHLLKNLKIINDPDTIYFANQHNSIFIKYKRSTDELFIAKPITDL